MGSLSLSQLLSRLFQREGGVASLPDEPLEVAVIGGLGRRMALPKSRPVPCKISPLAPHSSMLTRRILRRQPFFPGDLMLSFGLGSPTQPLDVVLRFSPFLPTKS